MGEGGVAASRPCTPFCPLLTSRAQRATSSAVAGRRAIESARRGSLRPHCAGQCTCCRIAPSRRRPTAPPESSSACGSRPASESAAPALPHTAPIQRRPCCASDEPHHTPGRRCPQAHRDEDVSPAPSRREAPFAAISRYVDGVDGVDGVDMGGGGVAASRPCSPFSPLLPRAQRATSSVVAGWPWRLLDRPVESRRPPALHPDPDGPSQDPRLDPIPARQTWMQDTKCWLSGLEPRRGGIA